MRKCLSTLVLILIICIPSQSQTIPEMIRITGGGYIMGEKDLTVKGFESYEGEQLDRYSFVGHRVVVSDFLMAKYEITVSQFYEFVLETGYILDYQKEFSVGNEFWKDYKGKDNHPMWMISAFDILSYCQWLSRETGDVYRIPTEAEWEYAAKGTNSWRYPWGNEIKILFPEGVNERPRKTKEDFAIDAFLGDCSVFGIIGLYGGSELTLDSYSNTFYLFSPEKNPLNTAGTNVCSARSNGIYGDPLNQLGILWRTGAIFRVGDYYEIRLVKETKPVLFNEGKTTACSFFQAQGSLRVKAPIKKEPRIEAETLGYLNEKTHVYILLKSARQTENNGKTDFWYQTIEATGEPPIGWIHGSELLLSDSSWY